MGGKAYGVWDRMTRQAVCWETAMHKAKAEVFRRNISARTERFIALTRARIKQNEALVSVGQPVEAQ